MTNYISFDLITEFANYCSAIALGFLIALLKIVSINFHDFKFRNFATLAFFAKRLYDYH